MRICDVEGCTERADRFIKTGRYAPEAEKIDLCFHHRIRALQLLELYRRGDDETLAAIEASYPEVDEDEVPF